MEWMSAINMTLSNYDRNSLQEAFELKKKKEIQSLAYGAHSKSLSALNLCLRNSKNKIN